MRISVYLDLGRTHALFWLKIPVVKDLYLSEEFTYAVFYRELLYKPLSI